MEVSDAVRRVPGGAEADLLVSPRSSRAGIEGVDPWRHRLVVRVRAPPLDGRANAEVEQIVSEASGGKARVTSGHASRQKTVFIEGDYGEICARLSRT